VLALAAPACGNAGRSATAALEPPARLDVALNSALTVALDGPIDPLSVTDRSISAVREDGRPLAARVGTSAGCVVVELVIDDALLAAPPPVVVVRLLGLPSPHAVATLDGRRLGASARIGFRVTSALEPRGSSPARIVEVAGSPPRPELELPAGGPLVLVVDGVLDPSTLAPEGCPLFPVEQGLVLPVPLLPEVRWRCLGERFELTLGLGGHRGRFQLDLRRFHWRDLSGGIPEPALVTEVVAP
jgi:hypothetical protein